jgi:hypothetical protein
MATFLQEILVEETLELLPKPDRISLYRTGLPVREYNRDNKLFQYIMTRRTGLVHSSLQSIYASLMSRRFSATSFILFELQPMRLMQHLPPTDPS